MVKLEVVLPIKVPIPENIPETTKVELFKFIVAPFAIITFPIVLGLSNTG